MKEKRTSLDDIAKKVGVSKATVSFVLNNKGDEYNISKEKQRIIRETAKELHYVPNFFAKSLRQGQTKTIGLVVSDISNGFYAQLCASIQAELQHSGYNVFIVNSNDDKERELILMRELIQRSIDGMIISPCNAINPLIPILNETHIPVVFTDRPGDENADFIGVDNQTEAADLVSKFSKIPKKLVLLISDTSNSRTSIQRLSGAREKCEDEHIIYKLVDLSKDQDVTNVVIKDLVSEGFDSFLALNSDCALAAFVGLKRNKIKIPKDVRLISFDDLDTFGYVEPSITALRQPVAEMGKKAVNRLLIRLKEIHAPGNHSLLPCELIIRESH